MERPELDHLLQELRTVETDTLRVEVKKARGGLPVSIHETFSAFANAEGGVLILGVDEADAFAVVGVENAAAMMNQLTSLCQRMEPVLQASINTIAYDKHKVVVAEIPAIPRDQRPCHKADKPYWDNSYIRVGDGDHRLSAYEVSILLANRTPNRYDVSTVKEAALSDLDSTALTQFILRIRETRSNFRDLSDERVLELLNVAKTEGDTVRPTLAGLLAFGIYPQQFFPQLNITIVVYPTTEAGVSGPRGERFLDNRSVDGPITSMVHDSIAILKRNMKQRSIITGLVRVNEYEYPEEALREALVNALAHRDYSVDARGTQIQVEMYPDRLLIRNPGGLFGPLSIRELGLDSSPASSRNPALLKILEDAPLGAGRTVCENRGSGIVTMRSVVTNAGMEPPLFQDNISNFTVVFPNHTLLDDDTFAWLATLDTTGLSRTQLTALALMRRGEQLTNVTYREATGIADSRAATNQLRELKDRKLVKQTGDRGQAHYLLAASDLPVIPSSESDPSNMFDGLDAGIQGQILRSLRGGQKSKREIMADTNLGDAQVASGLKRLRAQGLIELIGISRSPNSKWKIPSK